MKRFVITTLGCKVNQCESAGLARQLQSMGMVPAQNGQPADVCIVNSCTVTHKASMQSRQALRQIIRAHPGARIVATGCYAQTEPEAIESIAGIDLVVGNSDKHRIADLLTSIDASMAAASSDVLPRRFHGDIRCERNFGVLPPAAQAHRTRPFLKIQDGCDMFCSYCIVPHARGPSRSLPPSEVMAALEHLAHSGYQEVVLTGIHLGAYGADLTPAESLLQLMRRIDGVKDPLRIRISSIEPDELSDAIIDRIAASNRFCRHLHIPLQSGDDEILKRMRRPYRADLFAGRVEKIAARISDTAIGADVLVGFPGESDQAFENTFRLIERLPITYLHVFPFSPRPKTPAAKMADRVPDAVVKQRCARLRKLANEKQTFFQKGFVGRRVKVLVEGVDRQDPLCVQGLTDNYLNVRFQAGREQSGHICSVTIESQSADGRLMARLDET